MSDYCASKFGAIGLAESILLELDSEGYDGIKATMVCPFLINTGLFDGCRNAFVTELDAEQVAKKIVQAVLMNQKVLIMPKVLYITTYLKGLIPVECQIMLYKAIEGHKFMDTFKGRQRLTNGDANSNHAD